MPCAAVVPVAHGDEGRPRPPVDPSSGNAARPKPPRHGLRAREGGVPWLAGPRLLFDVRKPPMLNPSGMKADLSRPGIVALLVLCTSAAGCGLRTDPSFDGIGGGHLEDAGGEGREGSCTNPVPLTVESQVVVGTVHGGGLYTGWCGADEGPERVYSFVPKVSGDVTFRFIPEETDFTPTLRVQNSGCATDEGFTRMCVAMTPGTPRHMFLTAGVPYSLIVDSPEGTVGNFSLEISPGPPPLSQCSIHSEVIVQDHGATFVWNNDFSQGQGSFDSQCGGPGKDNLFRLLASYPGMMYVTLEGSDGFRPIVSVRTGCGASTELACTNEIDNGTPGLAVLEFFIPGAGEYYLGVDQLVVTGGAYSLQVDFE